MSDGARGSDTVRGGRTIGKYLLEGILGAGATCEVYRARHVELRRSVALKLFRPRGRLAQDELQRFLQEGRLAARVSHPSVVCLLDSGELDGRPYLVYELIEGGTLREKLEKDGPLGPAETIATGLALADALEAVHRAGIIHRDVKPANIFLSPQRGAMLGDLGCAKAQGDGWMMTAEGYCIGTPVYMAPEVCRAEPAVPASDLYSLGLVLYECLAGKPPFLGNDAAALQYQHCAMAPEDLLARRPDAGRELAELIHRLLAKPASERPRSASALGRSLKLLARAAAPEPQQPLPVPAPAPRRLQAVSAARPVPVAAAASLALAAVALPLWFASRPAPKPAPAVAPKAPTDVSTLDARASESVSRALRSLENARRAARTPGRGSTPGERARAARQSLVRAWNIALGQVAVTMSELTRLGNRAAADTARDAGRLLVTVFLTRNQCLTDFREPMFEERRLREEAGNLALGHLAFLELETLRTDRELAGAVGRLLAGLPPELRSARDPVLEAGLACARTVARLSLPGGLAAADAGKRILEQVKKSWPALALPGTGDCRDSVVPGALLEALRQIGATAAALELISAVKAHHGDLSANPGARTSEPAGLLIAADAAGYGLELRYNPLHEGTSRPDVEKALEEYLKIASTLERSWPWDPRTGPGAALAGQWSSQELEHLQDEVTRKLDFARARVRQLQRRLER